MITEERAQEAFTYLHDTTGKIGEAKAELERAEILRKRIRRRVFLASTGTVAEREARAESNEDVQFSDDRYIVAIQEYETLRAKRDIEGIAIDVWRTEESSRRKGTY